MTPTRRNSFAASVVAALVLVALATTSLCAAGPTSRPALPPRQVFAAATADSSWLVRPAIVAKGEPPHWTVLLRPRETTDGYWLQVGSLQDQPIAIAPSGDRLAVLDTDNSWSLVSRDGQISGPQPPSGLALLDVIDAGDHLTFLARSALSPKDPYLIDFDGRSFGLARLAQTFGGQALQQPRYAIVGPGVCFILDNGSVGTVDDAAQSSDGRVQVVREDDAVAIAIPKHDDVRISLPADALANRLSISDEPAGSIRFWWLAADQLMGQSFGANGQPVSDASPVLLRPVPTPTLFERALYIVGALALLLVLLAGGRQTIAVSKALAAKSPPKAAPLARRFAAGMIDCVPLAATVIYLIVGGKLTIYAGMLRFDGHRSEAILAAGVAFYLILLIAFELRWQFSIGKWIFALRVATIDGQLPGPRAILIRNVLRLVDLNIITLLIVPATPLRQRLGDFLAGTMVVDAFDAIPSATPRAAADDRSDSK